MQANPRHLIGLFEQTLRYVVPIFQRHYVWGEEDQWAPLWEDISEKLKQRLEKRKTSSHFLGAVILDAAKKKSTREVSRFIVIDGQQRITTVQLLLTALRDLATERGLATVAKAVSRSLLNQDPELMDNSAEEIYKLWPTQFNRKVFRDILDAGSHKKVNQLYPVIRRRRRRKPEPRDRLVEAYVFFYTRIEELCRTPDNSDTSEDVLIELYGVLRDDFAVVEIILGEDDDSQEIFNSLNAHGKPLSQSDLLRSFVFMRAEKSDEDRDRLYDQYWSRFEDEFWDVQERRGNMWSSRLDLLTRIFLSSKTGTAVDAKKVHLIYKNWIRTSNPFGSVEEELKAFVRYGDRFRYLVEPPGDDTYSGFARRLAIWDVSTAYPLAIYLFEEANLANDDLLECLLTLESFVVRRLVCRKDNKEYNKYFIEVVSRLRREGPSAEALRRVLSAGSGSTREWPQDAEFEHHWCSSPFYGALQASQIGTILKMIEDVTRTTKTEKVTVPSVSVEHVMPQEWAERYPLNGASIPKDMAKDWYYSPDQSVMEQYEKIRDAVQARNKAIHGIGNLTIVTHPLNSAMRNNSFVTKKEELRNSVLLLNRYFDKHDQWDEARIEIRAKSLFETAKQIWGGP